MTFRTTGLKHGVLPVLLAVILVVPAIPQPGDSEMGLASWYGDPYHGRNAASGEIYDMEALTAAHPTLPFNTWVRVVNLNNDKSVDVRITDRGPFIDGRIIDLSRAAARTIDLLDPGTARVRVDVIRAADPAATPVLVAHEVREAPVRPAPAIPPAPTVPAPGSGFAVQVGAFRDKGNAERFTARMQGRYGAAYLVLHEGNPAIWRVMVGSEPTRDGADALAARIRQDSHENNAFVVRLDS